MTKITSSTKDEDRLWAANAGYQRTRWTIPQSRSGEIAHFHPSSIFLAKNDWIFFHVCLTASVSGLLLEEVLISTAIISVSSEISWTFRFMKIQHQRTEDLLKLMFDFLLDPLCNGWFDVLENKPSPGLGMVSTFILCGQGPIQLLIFSENLLKIGTNWTVVALPNNSGLCRPYGELQHVYGAWYSQTVSHPSKGIFTHFMASLSGSSLDPFNLHCFNIYFHATPNCLAHVDAQDG